MLQDYLELELDEVLTIIFNIVLENNINSKIPKIVVIYESGSINDSLVAKFSEIIKLSTITEVKVSVN